MPKNAPNTMKRVLVYENRKVDASYFDASTEELEAGAFLALFKLLDESWQVYGALEDPEEAYCDRPDGHPDGCMCEACVAHRKEAPEVPRRERDRIEHLELYRRAKKGEAWAARALLTARKDYEYERFKFERVESAVSSYPLRVWGVTKPCGEAFVAENGVYRWGLHGQLDSRKKREGRTDYGFKGSLAASIKYLTKGGILHFDADSKTELDLGDETWKFRAREKNQTDEDWLFRGLNADSRSDKKIGLAILEAGSMKPGKVIHLTEQVCGGCRRDMNRFGSDDDE